MTTRQCLPDIPPYRGGSQGGRRGIPFRFPKHICRPYLNGFSVPHGVCAGPRIQAAYQTFNGHRRLIPVNVAQGLGKHFGVTGSLLRLGGADYGSLLHLLKGGQDQFPASQAQLIMEASPCLIPSMGITTFSSMSPVSRPTSIIMVVMPVSFSPSMTHHWMGAAPLYLGSRDAWMLTQP